MKSVFYTHAGLVWRSQTAAGVCSQLPPCLKHAPLMFAILHQQICLPSFQGFFISATHNPIGMLGLQTLLQMTLCAFWVTEGRSFLLVQK